MSTFPFLAPGPDSGSGTAVERFSAMRSPSRSKVTTLALAFDSIRDWFLAGHCCRKIWKPNNTTLSNDSHAHRYVGLVVTKRGPSWRDHHYPKRIPRICISGHRRFSMNTARVHLPPASCVPELFSIRPASLYLPSRSIDLTWVKACLKWGMVVFKPALALRPVKPVGTPSSPRSRLICLGHPQRLSVVCI